MNVLLSILWGWALLASSSGLQENWEDSVVTYQSGQPEKAAEKFDRWIEQADEVGIHSFEAHYNAGLAHSYARPGPEASLHLLKATQLTYSPFKISAVRTQLARVQRELGVQDSLVKNFTFGLRLHLNRSTIFLWGSVLLWGLLLSFILAVRSKDKWAWGGFAVVFLFCATITGVAALAQYNDQKFGVVSGLSATKITEDGGEKLLELPPGTLVNYLTTEDGRLRILGPISGYAPKGAIEPVTI